MRKIVVFQVMLFFESLQGFSEMKNLETKQENYIFFLIIFVFR